MRHPHDRMRVIRRAALAGPILLVPSAVMAQSVTHRPVTVPPQLLTDFSYRTSTSALTQPGLINSGVTSSRAIAEAAKPQSLSNDTPQPQIDVQPVEDDEVVFSADHVSREDEDSPIIAEGNVRAYFGRRFLRADRLIYDPMTDVVEAEGNVSITDENLETTFAGRVALSGDLRDGLAENFAALLDENARLAAENAIQEQGARTKLRNAVYTACNVCDDAGEGKTPTWRIRALRVTRDRERRVVRFRHAFVEIKGIPILYTPYIQGPDPSVERQSGFLTPLIGASERLGFRTEIPYYFALSNHMDATLFPKYTSKAGTLWQGEFRRRGNNSYHVISGGIINFDNPQPSTTSNIPGTRWNVFASGHHKFKDNWRAGYDIERVSDNTFLRNFDVRRRGDLRKELDTSNTNRLRSNAFVQWKRGGSKLTINSYLFQGLRATDQADLTPYILPQINFTHRFGQKWLGGTTAIEADFVSLQRTSGVDTRRLTASAYWEREHITATGHRFKGYAQLRGDAYFIQDLDEGTELTNGGPVDAASVNDPTRIVGRLAPTAALEWSYPLSKSTKYARLFIEPRVQFVASPSNRNDEDIINEDSQSIEYDFAGLFEYNKATGFDRFEDGQRVNVGIRAVAELNNSLTIEGTIGEQFRLQDTNAFDLSTGLGEKRSDLVGSLDIHFRNRIGIQNSFRVDDDNLSLKRAESLAYLRFWRLGANLSYVRLNQETLANLKKREELSGNINMRLSNHWSTAFGWREDLIANETIRQDFTLRYRDECSSLALTYRRDRTSDIGLGTDNAFLIQFTLRSLVD